MASKSLGTLTLDLIAKIGGFEQGMDKAARTAERRMKQISDTASKAGKVLSGLGATAAVGLMAMTQSAISSAAEMAKLAQLANTGAEEFQKLAYGASQAGISQEKLADIYKDAQDKVGDYLQNGAGPLVDFFDNVARKAGVSAEQFRNLSGPDALGLYFSTLEKANLSQSELVFYMEAIASDSAMLIPLLKDNAAGFKSAGDEAERMGLVMGNDAVQAALEFAKQSDALRQSLNSIGIGIAKEVLPELNRITTAMMEARKEAGILEMAWVGLGGVMAEALGLNDSPAERLRDIERLLKGGVLDRVRLFGRDGLIKYYSEDELRAEMARLQAQLKEDAKKTGGGGGETTAPAPTGPSKEFEKIAAQLRQQVALYGAVGEAAKIRYQIESGAIKDLKPGEAEQLIRLAEEYDARVNVAKAAEEQAKAAEALQTAYEGRLEQYARELALSGEITELERLRFDITNGALVGINAEQQKRLEGLAEEIDKLKERQQLEQDVASLVKGLRTEEEVALDNYIESMNTLNKAVADGIPILGGYDEQARRVWQRYQDDVKKASEATDELSVFAEQAARNMQDAFADFLFDPFEDGLEGMLQNFGRMLQRMAAEAAAAKIMESLGGGTGKDFDWGKAISTVGSWFAGFFDSGGTIGAGQWGIVGERGPELVRGPAHVTSRADTAKALGGTTVSVGQMVFPNVRTAAEATQAAGAAARQLSRLAGAGQRYS